MCVIMFAESERISAENIAKGYEANSSGAGIAWREGGFVHWRKGLNLDDIIKFSSKVPTPYVCHFRIPTVGGPLRELTHPFPIDVRTTNALEGRTKGRVLFHNGHWQAWKTTMLESTVKTGVKMPIGKWSDSRAMAFVAAIHGVGILELIDERAIVFGPDDMDFFGSGWDNHEGIFCSNKSWCYRSVGNAHRGGGGSMWTSPPASLMPRTQKQNGQPSSEKASNDNGNAGGHSQETTFRTPGSGSTESGGEAVEQEAEGSSAEVGAGYEGDPEGGEPPNGPLIIETVDDGPKVTLYADADATHQLIRDIMDSRSAGFTETLNEAEKVLKRPLSLNEAREAHRWACGINPKTYRQNNRPDPEGEAHRRQRLEDARKGIVRFGRL